jgi:hypothetical protein
MLVTVMVRVRWTIIMSMRTDSVEESLEEEPTSVGLAEFPRSLGEDIISTGTRGNGGSTHGTE